MITIDKRVVGVRRLIVPGMVPTVQNGKVRN